MNSRKQKSVCNVVFDRAGWNGSIRVSLHSYLRFNRWMDEELSKLIAQWSPSSCYDPTRHGCAGRVTRHNRADGQIIIIITPPGKHPT